jgi:hypothetical protein
MGHAGYIERHMTKMNWDRVRSEDRDLRRGAEWVSSESYSLPYSDPTKSSLNVSAANGSKGKKKKKKKHKLARQSIQVRPNGNVTVKPRLPVSTLAKTPVLAKPSGILKNPLVRPAQPRNHPKDVEAQKAPLIASKSMSSGPKSTQRSNTGGSLRMSSGKPVMTIAEMQKLAIRLYKALGSNRMSEASSLASEVYGESLHHMEHVKVIPIETLAETKTTNMKTEMSRSQNKGTI